jgi:energy-coupling factor transport system substrate-specific component
MTFESRIDMEQTAKNTPKAQGGAESRRWGVKEVVTAVLFSALIIVIQISIAAISTINIDVSMVASTAISSFAVAPLYFLMIMRVNRFGTTIFLAGLTSLAFCLMGNYWYMIPFYFAGGLIIELLFLRTPALRSKPNCVVGAWTTYSSLYVLSSIIPIYVNLTAYIQETLEVRQVGQAYIDAYLKYYTSWEWLVGIVAITAIGGLLGALVGKRLMKKHFAKAGAI